MFFVNLSPVLLKPFSPAASFWAGGEAFRINQVWSFGTSAANLSGVLWPPLCSWSYNIYRLYRGELEKQVDLFGINQQFGCFEHLTLSCSLVFINFCICTFAFLHFSAAGLSGVLLMPFAASPIESEKQADLFGINQGLRVGSLNGDGQNWMLWTFDIILCSRLSEHLYLFTFQQLVCVLLYSYLLQLVLLRCSWRSKPFFVLLLIYQRLAQFGSFEHLTNLPSCLSTGCFFHWSSS